MDDGRRHVPLRTCLACGNKTTKSELSRIVATPQGTVEMDSTGKASGRGAYICKDRKGGHAPLKKGRLEYALRRGLRDEEWAKLEALIESTVIPETA